MNHKRREEAAHALLAALGWTNCNLPLLVPFENIDENELIEVRAGNLMGICEKIRSVLELLGHTGGGSCSKDSDNPTEMEKAQVKASVSALGGPPEKERRTKEKNDENFSRSS